MNPTIEQPKSHKSHKSGTFIWVSGHFNRSLRRRLKQDLPKGRTFNIGKRKMKNAARALAAEVKAARLA